jgi:hypothetical protein
MAIALTAEDSPETPPLSPLTNVKAWLGVLVMPPVTLVLVNVTLWVAETPLQLALPVLVVAPVVFFILACLLQRQTEVWKMRMGRHHVAGEKALNRVAITLLVGLLGLLFAGCGLGYLALGDLNAASVVLGLALVLMPLVWIGFVNTRPAKAQMRRDSKI